MKPQSGLQPILTKFVNTYQKPLQFALRIALLLFAIGIILELTIGFYYLIFISATACALLFFIHAFRVIPDDEQSSSVMDSFGLINFSNKLNYLALAISSMGILFSVSNTVGRDQMLIVGGITIFILSIYYILIKQKPNGSLIKTELIFTNLIFLLISVVFILR